MGIFVILFIYVGLVPLSYASSCMSARYASFSTIWRVSARATEKVFSE